MTGQEYLKNIQTELKSGRRQYRMGRSVLRAFGYVRRRAPAIEEINKTLEELELVAIPSISSEMPLKLPRIRFSLRSADGTSTLSGVDVPEPLDFNGIDPPLQDDEDNDVNLPEPAFSVYELKSANAEVEWVPPDASLQIAYTKMVRYKYSQLVVASSKEPRQQDIKGIVSFQSIATALMNGKPATVGDCMDKDVSYAQGDTDLKSVLTQLSANDVVLVIGQDKRLQGIVTAWDLAEEFANLVDPFKRIGEIEERLQALIGIRLGKDKVAEFLRDDGSSGDNPIVKLSELTMGELERVLEFPGHWEALRLAFDRGLFISALSEVRDCRNRLMHFGDPLSEDEMAEITNFCDMVRTIQL